MGATTPTSEWKEGQGGGGGRDLLHRDELRLGFNRGTELDYAWLGEFIAFVYSFLISITKFFFVDTHASFTI